MILPAIRRLREARYCERLRREAIEEVARNGFGIAADLIEAHGGVVPKLGALTTDDVERMVARAEARGALSDEVILAYGEEVGIPRSAVQAVGDDDGGGILGFFRRIVEWLKDPANREKVLAVIKFIVMILAMFGI